MTPGDPKSVEAVTRKLHDRGLYERVKAICLGHFVTVDEVLSRSRVRHVVLARHHLFFDLYPVLGSYPAVGWVLGFDHASVMYGVHKYQKRKDAP